MNIAGEIKRINELEELQTIDNNDMVIVQKAAGGTMKMTYGDLVGEIKREFTEENSFMLTNVNGWTKAIELTGNSITMRFSAASPDSLMAVSGVLTTLLNASAQFAQLSEKNLDKLHRIDKVAAVFAGGKTGIYIHTEANIQKINLVISGSYEEAVLANEPTEELPDDTYVYSFKDDAGIVADRAINDGNGNNIAESMDEIKSNVASLKAQVAIGPAGWKRILTIPGGLMCFVSVYRNFNYAAPQGVTMMLNTTFYGTSTGRRAIISQLEDLSEQNYITEFRITHDGTQEYLEMYYSSSTTNVFDITVSGICCQNLKPPVIDVAAVTEEYDVIYSMRVNPNTAGYPRKLITPDNMNMWDCLYVGSRGSATSREVIYFPVYTSSCILNSSHVYVDVNDERNPASVNLHMDNSSLVVQMTTARVTQRAPIWLISYIDNSTLDLTRGTHTVIFGGCSLGTNVVSNCTVLGDLNIASGNITFNNCSCNLKVTLYGRTVVVNNCTGSIIDEHGNNLIS